MPEDQQPNTPPEATNQLPPAVPDSQPGSQTIVSDTPDVDTVPAVVAAAPSTETTDEPSATVPPAFVVGSAMTPEQARAITHSADGKKWWQFYKYGATTRAYLPEYAVLLIVIGSLLGVVNALFGSIIDAFGAGGNLSAWSGKWAYSASLGLLAAVLALIPLLLVFSRRTATSEAETPAVKDRSWRKAFLGVFLLITGLTTIGYIVGFLFVVVSAISNSGLGVETDNKVWQSLVKNGFAIVLFGCSALLYARDYRPQQSGHYVLWRRVHRYALVALAVIVTIVFVAFPLSKQRAAYLDDLIVNDLNSISSKIKAYAQDKRKLPASLSDITLADGVQARLEKLHYEYKAKKGSSAYELCATFRTDATDKKDDIVTDYLYGGMSAREASDPITPSKHGKGYQCFNFTASGVRTTTPSTRYNYNIDDTYDSSLDDYDYETQ